MASIIIGISICLLAIISVSGIKRYRPEPVEADHAFYPVNHQFYGEKDPAKIVNDERENWFPRKYAHSIYRFGHCTTEMTSKQYLAKKSNITITDFKSARTSYVYLIERGGTIRYRTQCIIMRIMVPRKYVFKHGRIPVYYCHGYLRYVYLVAYLRYDIHEFYLHQTIDMPVYFDFEFYHAPPLNYFTK